MKIGKLLLVYFVLLLCVSIPYAYSEKYEISRFYYHIDYSKTHPQDFIHNDYIQYPPNIKVDGHISEWNGKNVLFLFNRGDGFSDGVGVPSFSISLNNATKYSLTIFGWYMGETASYRFYTYANGKLFGMVIFAHKNFSNVAILINGDIVNRVPTKNTNNYSFSISTFNRKIYLSIVVGESVEKYTYEFKKDIVSVSSMIISYATSGLNHLAIYEFYTSASIYSIVDDQIIPNYTIFECAMFSLLFAMGVFIWRMI